VGRVADHWPDWVSITGPITVLHKFEISPLKAYESDLEHDGGASCILAFDEFVRDVKCRVRVDKHRNVTPKE
jgi:hypothetical protein